MTLTFNTDSASKKHHPKLRAHSYVFSQERAHLVRPGAMDVFFNCFRCRRRLPESQFSPVAQKRWKSEWVLVLHPHCRRCREQARGKWVSHPLYSPEIDTFFGKLLTSVNSGAKNRGILVGIDKDDLLELWFEQRGHCAISGLALNWTESGRAGRGNRAKLRPSVDRISSHGNYVIGNVQIVASVVNAMKNDMSQDVFVELCAKIAAHCISL